MDNTDSPLPEGSDEPKAPAGAADANKQTDEGKKDEPKTLSPEAIAELIQSRQDAKAEKRRMADELKAERDAREADRKALESLKKERETEARRKEQEEAAKNGDIDKLRESAAREKAELLAEIERVNSEAQAKLDKAERTYAEAEESILKAKAFSFLSQLTIDPDVAFTLLRDRMKLADGDVIIKDDVRDFPKFVEQHFEETGKSYLLKTKRSAGSGAQPEPAVTSTSSTAASQASQLTREQIAKLPDRGRDYFMKNPDAAKEFLGKR